MTDQSILQTCIHFRDVAHATLRDMRTTVQATTYDELRRKRENINTIDRQIAGLLQRGVVKSEIDVMNKMADYARTQTPFDVPEVFGYAVILSVALTDLCLARALADSALASFDPPSLAMPDADHSDSPTTDADHSDSPTTDGDDDGDSSET